MTTISISTLKAAGLSEKQIALAVKFAEGNGRTGKVPRVCKCGCGGMTKGGIFRPGHDMKLLSAVLHGTAVVPDVPKRNVAKNVGGTRVDVTTGQVDSILDFQMDQ